MVEGGLGEMTAALRAAARRSEARQRLLRARELCLLGDYERGVPEFRHVLHELRRQCAFKTAVPDVRQFLQELQAEYALMVQYQRSLEELRALGAGTRPPRQRSRASPPSPSNAPTATTRARTWERPTSRLVAAAVDDDATGRRGTENAKETTTPPQPALSAPVGGPHIAAATKDQRRLPAWARPHEPPMRDPMATTKTPPARSVLSRKRPVASTTSATTTKTTGRRVGVRDKENIARNVVARRSGATAQHRNQPSGGMPQMKNTAEMALRRRSSSNARSSVGSRRSSTSPGREVPSDLIAGKKKYSDVAREGDWADQELIESIEREIVDRGERLSFDDIAGLHETKQLLQEAVMLPQIAPHLFQDGLLKHCSGILLFGPPGTGKTLLAKAVANECGLTFFNVSASTLSSKYRGDSEKLVRILFEMARYYAPSIIFMDEIDSIASARGGANEHEASRRVKTELLVQISGVPSGEHETTGHVMLLAATNLPWELDEAMRRRLTKRVYIPLPGADARLALFTLNLRKVELAPDVDVKALVQETEGYSGDDITNVCETAKRMPVKRMYTPDVLNELSRRRLSQSPGCDEAPALEHQPLVVTKNDFHQALRNVSKSVGHDQLRRFERWEAEFGSK